MDIDQARTHIMAWITEFVEQPQAQLGGWPPCPFARRARLENRFEIRAGRVDPYTDLAHIDISGRDVVIVVYEPQEFAAEEFNRQITAVNQAFLVPRDLVALADHPQDPEQVNGVVMNQGQWALALVQPLEMLNQHAQQLARRGFYDGWPEPYLQLLFEHRRDPRS